MAASMADDRPTWLVEALDAFETSPLSVSEELRLQPGVLVLVEPMVGSAGSRRLALVLEVNPRTASAVVALVANHVDDRTDADFVVEPVESGLPFAVAIEADIVGACLETQLSQVVGVVPDVIVSAVRGASIGSSIADEDWRRGMTLQGPSDYRWAWKEDEIEVMRDLAARCTAVLLAPPPVDPGLFAFDAGTRSEVIETLVEMADRVRAGAARLPPWFIAELGLAEEQTLDDLRRTLGMDAWLAIEDVLLEALASNASVVPPEGRSTALPGRALRPQSDPLRRVVAEQARAKAAVLRVLTAKHLWTDHDETMPVAVDVDGSEFRIVRELVAA
jgi:CBS domain-containing protein